MGKEITKPTYTVTEELVMRRFDKDEIPYRCARIELWIPGEPYNREVGHFRVPYDLFDKIREMIEGREFEDKAPKEDGGK